ncbi:hypothetical protein QA612_09900 [Evansella sp. AB-P1]|uniref:hypothetical protein n=1 Tax=Evansella sp. AB-P1 TaxID=3037653 RepID=UPI00241EB45E|nr:hypothetical protein [Evansella sp. AB-P1]MDG5787812.1 hypothetical protein [Evansella sp. AB-P1]
MSDAELLNTYNVPLIRNFEVQYLKPLIGKHIPDFNKAYNEAEGVTGWAKITDLLNKKVRDGFDDSEIENELFEKLVFDVPDHIFILPLISEIDANEFMERHSDAEEINRRIAMTLPSETKLITIRQVDNKVVLLYRSGVAEVGEVKASLYIPCILDFENDFAIVKVRLHHVKMSNTNLHEIHQLVINDINDNEDFDFTISNFNSKSIHEVLFQMFEDESYKAEKVIKKHMDEFTESTLIEKVTNFLEEDLKLKDPDNYIDRVKSAFYQDLSSQLGDEIFYEGYVFAISFLDRELTRSATRNSKRDPIYNKKIYWNLKDLIHEQQELTEISLYWRFDKEDFTKVPVGKEFSFVEISLREKNGSLEIHFYNTKTDRRLKEDYVIYKIKDYL